ncbi:MAG: bifunctional diguanylate cyclase/phosphodiesterase [Paracoccus sp.]|nr:bifunctional diguanylate cyclase/phosphodiesterase [Paracoccus sp. (in: a-proteobacteria)]
MKLFPEASRGLANRIGIFVLLGILLLYLAVGISLDSIKRQVNHQAEIDSVQEVSQSFNSLQDQVRQFARDYNNWGDVYLAIINNDIDFISDNYGITAVNGDMFDGAVIYDGMLADPLAWVSNGTRAPQKSSLSISTLEQIRIGVDKLPKEGRATFDFAIINDNKLQLGSASRILPDTAEALSFVIPENLSIGVILRTITNEQISYIARNSNVTDLQITQVEKQSKTVMPIIGVDGTAFAYFHWLPPRPGSELLGLIAPIIGVIFVVIGSFGIGGARLLRNHAKSLALREEEASRLARSDTLTGLPNRLALKEYGERLDAKGTDDYAVILLDINNFKKVNDLAGHQGGDELIKDFSKKLRESVDSQIFIARVGGDEFVAVVKDSTHITELARHTVNIFMKATELCFNYHGLQFPIKSSYGIATKTVTSVAFDDLLGDADRAMYVSKNGTGNQVTIYNTDLDAKYAAERKIEEALRVAIGSPDELYMLYQPIVDARTMKLHSVEALARWNSSSLGPISPSVFIAIAEKSGLMVELGWVLLKKTLSDMQHREDLRVNINISPLQLLAPEFIPTLRCLLIEYEISPTRVEIELTENVFVSSCDIVRSQLHQLREIGITTALDDFGTGFSSIGYLQTMPFDTLKIDRSFVSGLGDNETLGNILRSIVSLGRTLGKSITAEGVETLYEAEILADAGCHYLQGYLFSRPQPLDQVLRPGADILPSSEPCVWRLRHALAG